ncbi:MAG TPA: helix-turn-helix transcriptional regulator [Terriglobales bacterium]|nr:helix-turn-helix transcriptional regulator [Terriglobales bacterium]
MIDNSQLDVTRQTPLTEPTSVETEASAFLKMVGENVRRVRAERGMTRKALSVKSEVSERFLAQLETGTGHASILVLRQIADALDVSIVSLLMTSGSSATDNDSRQKRIALIGLRGAGKSTVGKLLAEELGVPFFELDRLVEEASGVPMNMVFDLYGQGGFRRFERRCLEELLEKESAFVLATGGGIVSEAETFSRLRERCFSVWLQATPEEHMSRVIAQGDMRPMAQHPEAMSELKHILADRESLYARADLTIRTSGRSVESIKHDIVAAVRSNFLQPK